MEGATRMKLIPGFYDKYMMKEDGNLYRLKVQKFQGATIAGKYIKMNPDKNGKVWLSSEERPRKKYVVAELYNKLFKLE